MLIYVNCLYCILQWQWRTENENLFKTNTFYDEIQMKIFYSILFYPFVNDLIVNNKRKEDEITINSSYLIRYKWIQVKIDDLKEC